MTDFYEKPIGLAPFTLVDYDRIADYLDIALASLEDQDEPEDAMAITVDLQTMIDAFSAMLPDDELQLESLAANPHAYFDGAIAMWEYLRRTRDVHVAVYYPSTLDLKCSTEPAPRVAP